MIKGVTQSLQVLVVGRQSASSKPDIAVPSGEDTVGRSHIELTVGAGGMCYVTDLNSANGTFVEECGKWKRVQQSSVRLDSRIRLGEFRTTPAELLAMRLAPARPDPQVAQRREPEGTSAAASKQRKPGGKPRRNPLTGEVE